MAALMGIPQAQFAQPLKGIVELCGVAQPTKRDLWSLCGLEISGIGGVGQCIGAGERRHEFDK
jgi:hypothetical protein